MKKVEVFDENGKYVGNFPLDVTGNKIILDVNVTYRNQETEAIKGYSDVILESGKYYLTPFERQRQTAFGPNDLRERHNRDVANYNDEKEKEFREHIRNLQSD